MIHVGTSGFFYDDWKGRWYPPDLPRSRMFDYYAKRFGAVEINSTFYQIPSPRMMQSLIRRSEGRMLFTAKLNQEMTHRGNLSPHVVRGFNAAMEPAVEIDQLKAVLIQFPFKFTWNTDSRRYLERILDHFRHLPLVVEIRHASWRSPDAWQFFTDRNLSLCITDMPQLEDYPENSDRLTGPIAYFRFHGRNTKWFEEDHSFAPYDYLYSQTELEPWVEPIRQAESRTQLAVVFFNNHPLGQAPTNAHQMMELLGQTPPERGYTDLFADQFLGRW